MMFFLIGIVLDFGGRVSILIFQNYGLCDICVDKLSLVKGD